MVVGHTVAELWQFIGFQNSCYQLSWIFKSSNFNCRYSSQGQHVSSCQISCRSDSLLRRYGHFSIFQDGGRPPYSICYRRNGTTIDVYIMVSITAKFGWNPCSLVSTMFYVLIFCVFGLKTSIHDRNGGIWGL